MYNEHVTGRWRVLWVGPIILAVACGCAPTQTYPGPALPRSEVALLKDTSNASVLAIDGAPASGMSWTLLPGSHDVLLHVRVFTQVPNVEWTIWTYCRVSLIAVAGEEYLSRVRIRKEVAPGLSEQVKMEVGIADAAGALQAVAHSCSPNRPRLKH